MDKTTELQSGTVSDGSTDSVASMHSAENMVMEISEREVGEEEEEEEEHKELDISSMNDSDDNDWNTPLQSKPKEEEQDIEDAEDVNIDHKAPSIYNEYLRRESISTSDIPHSLQVLTPQQQHRPKDDMLSQIHDVESTPNREFAAH